VTADANVIPGEAIGRSRVFAQFRGPLKKLELGNGSRCRNRGCADNQICRTFNCRTRARGRDVDKKAAGLHLPGMKANIGPTPIRIGRKIWITGINARGSGLQVEISASTVHEERIGCQVPYSRPRLRESAVIYGYEFLRSKVRMNRILSADNGVGEIDIDVTGTGIGFGRGAHPLVDADNRAMIDPKGRERAAAFR